MIREAGFSTRAIHEGATPDAHGALVPPLYLTSTFAFPNSLAGAARFAGKEDGFIYGRISNPTAMLLEARMASLEGAQAGLATASGMGAIASLMWTLLRPGDEIITDMTLYGCTFALFRRGLEPFGVTVKHVDLTDPVLLEQAISSRTKLVYFETPANPNMRIVDIAAVAAIAHRNEALVVVDNTFCTPALQRPIELGADLVVHSATKYLGGHGDLLAGIVVGSTDHISAIRLHGLKDMTGAVISPFDAFLVLRGLKTLELRMERHCASALRIAALLEAHEAVETVLYTGLPHSPFHALASRQMNGRHGGMIAFSLAGGAHAAHAFLDALKLVRIAVSLGDAETLAQHPASMTHSTYDAQERERHGISDGLVRLSIGLEDVDDIWADISQALAAAVEPDAQIRAAA